MFIHITGKISMLVVCRAALNGKIAEIEMVRALQGQLIRERFDEKISTAERRKETDLAQQ